MDKDIWDQLSELDEMNDLIEEKLIIFRNQREFLKNDYSIEIENISIELADEIVYLIMKAQLLTDKIKNKCSKEKIY